MVMSRAFRNARNALATQSLIRAFHAEFPLHSLLQIEVVRETVEGFYRDGAHVGLCNPQWVDAEEYDYVPMKKESLEVMFARLVLVVDILTNSLNDWDHDEQWTAFDSLKNLIEVISIDLHEVLQTKKTPEEERAEGRIYQNQEKQNEVEKATNAFVDELMQWVLSHNTTVPSSPMSLK